MSNLNAALQARAEDAIRTIDDVLKQDGKKVFTTSFGAEDMVVLDLLANHREVEVATLDTGRLPEETYTVWQRAGEHFRRKIIAVYPQADDVAAFVRINGINGFYDSVSQRQQCCHVRKVEPLNRALQGASVWITGLRRSQAQSRGELAIVGHDETRGLLKFSPLADWSEDDVWDYIRARGIPYNALHDRGYPSIGCAPCTRAIAPGEDLRAGRWWWESQSGKECGLHVTHEEAEVVR